MSLQYQLDALNEKYTILKERLLEQQKGAGGPLPSNINIDSNPKHDFEHHNRLKLKLYDRINDLAWRYRSRLEKGTEERSHGRQIPVKDLWRWFKQMYKAWKKGNGHTDQDDDKDE